MQPGLPPLVWLRAFESAARHLSFTDAAAELNLTQAAISKQVKSLEQYFREPLFIRLPRSLQLTKTGEAYLPKVRDALERLAVGTREVFGHRRAQELTLRCAVSFSVNWLAPRLCDFFHHYPGKSVRIISTVWNDSLEEGLFDLDIQYGKGDWSNARSHRLTWETITPLCAPSMLQETSLETPDDLRTQRLLHVLGYQEGWGVWLRAAGSTQVDPGQGLQVDNSLTAFELAAHGCGVALGRRSLGERDRSSGRLVAPFELEVPIQEGFYLIEPSGKSAHPDAQGFIDWLVSAAVCDMGIASGSCEQ